MKTSKTMLLLVFLFFIPILFLVIESISYERELLSLFWQYQLQQVLEHTLIVGVVISLFSSLLGVFWGYLIQRYDFFARKTISWLLAIPLAIPAYIYSFLYLSLWQQWVNHQRPLGLLIMLFVFSTFPYMYLLCLQYFSKTAPSLHHAGKLCRLSPLQVKLRISLPLLKPTLIAGFGLIFMEYIADFGAVSLFGLNTISVSIYKMWTSYFSFSTASLLCSLLLLVVFIALYFQGKLKNYSYQTQTPQLKKVSPLLQTLILLMACGQITLSVFLPIGYLLFLSLSSQLTGQLSTALFHTGSLSFLFALMLTFFTFFILIKTKLRKSSLAQILQYGYATPGTLIAVAASLPFFFLQQVLPISLPYIAFSSLILLYAWTLRFFKVSYEPLSQSFHQISQNLHAAIKLHSQSKWQQFTAYYLPLLKKGMITSTLLVFIEVTKELPIALLTRPLGMELLSVQVYQYTAESQWNEAAIPALIIILLSGTGLYWILGQKGVLSAKH